MYSPPINAQSPGAYVASAVLHALIVALIIFSAYYVKNRDDGPPIFELVGGEGTNYAATEAPPLGEPGATGVDQVVLPPSPVRIPDPEPVAPAPEPVAVVQPVAPPPLTPQEASPVKPVSVTKAPPVTEVKAPDFAKNIARLTTKRAANIEKKFQAEQKAKAERERKAAEAQAKRMTKADFDKANKTSAKTAAAPKATGTSVRPPSVAAGIRGGMAGAPPSNSTSGAGGTAMARAEADLMSAYLALIVQTVRKTMEEASFGDELTARIQFTVSSAGTISGMRILTSSGSNEFDRAVLDAFRNVPDLGPPPNGKSGSYSANLVMSDRG